MYHFDKIIDRRGTDTVKYGRLKSLFGREDLIPLWVADMDFETPPFIREALIRRLEHPIYGYTMPPDSYWKSITDWQYARHGWHVEREWLAYIPGIVKGIGLAVNVFTKPGDSVIIQPPVYHPFRLVTEHNGRKVLNNPLIWDGKRYHMDFIHLESLLKNQYCPLLLLSNPHNPGGCIWSKDTLNELAVLCAKYNVLVVSDEIHADMALYGNDHNPFAMTGSRAAEISITFGAPSKTFNMAGIVSSFAVIPNRAVREPFYNFLHANELSDTTFMATVATEAAFRLGEDWRKEMLAYVEDNIDYVATAISERIPAIKVPRPDASFLVWLDCRGLKEYGIDDIPGFFTEAGLALNNGAMFGPGGEGFMRLNVGCPRSILKTAIDRLAEHFEKTRTN